MADADVDGTVVCSRQRLPLRISLGVGAALWLGRVVMTGVAPRHASWAVTLLLFSPLVLFPLLLALLQREWWPTSARRWLDWVIRLQGPAAWLLVSACLVPHGVTSALLTLPWLAVTGLIAGCGMMRFLSRSQHGLSELCLEAGLVYVVVGSMWLMLWRLGRWPLGYRDVIVLLTAVHFHYAGIVLPIITAWAARRNPGRLATAACVGVVAGIPLTAVGITSSHFGFTPLLECVIAWELSLAAILTAWLQFRSAMHRDVPATGRLLLSVSSVCLTGAMVLAGLYGMRYLGGPEWLDIPWMRALHGTANAFGTCFCGLLGWSLALPRPVDDSDGCRGLPDGEVGRGSV